MNKNQWGPTPNLKLKTGEIYARVIEEQRTLFQLATAEGILVGQLTGKFLGGEERPVIGDWLAVRPLEGEDKAMIQSILPRHSLLQRKAAGEGHGMQALAANIDVTFIVTSMNRDFNPKRLDRYLTIVHDSGSRAAVVLTKMDLEPESVKFAEELAAKHKVPCIPVSSLAGEGLEALQALLLPQETVVFIGSSGVGKSTLVNTLLGSTVQTVKAVREDDDRGRHTTTARRMLRLPNGCLVIDTPGLREIQIDAGQAEGLEEANAQIAELALRCRFSNCSHESEPGCAVKAALASGQLSELQHASYLKLKKELSFQARKSNKQLEAENKKQWKTIAKGQKQHYKKKRSVD